MPDLLKLIILIIIFLSPSYSFSQSNNIQYNRSQPEILNQVNKRESNLIAALETERDPEKRREIISKLIKVQNLYYNDKVKRESVKKLSKIKHKDSSSANDVFDPSVTQQNNMPPLTIFSANSREWESYPAEEKIKFCSQMLKECEQKNAMDYCRFVVVKCRSFMKEEDYQAIVDKYSN